MAPHSSGADDLLYLNYLALIGLMLLVGVCRAQGAGSGYFYPFPQPDPGYRSGYQWRPSDDQQSFHDGDVRGGAELLTGEHQPEWNLPPGAYRPIKEPQTLSPQVGAYRFRIISPEEQSHYATSDSGKASPRRDPRPAQFRFRREDSNQNHRSPGMYNQPSFRPDEELSGGSQRPAAAYQQYKLPVYSDPVYSTPVFREGVRER